MAAKVTSPASSGTVRPVPVNVVPLGTAGGKVGPEAGKISPAQQASIRALNLDEVVQKLNVRSKSLGRAVRFQVDVVSGRSVILVFNRDTGELIRQIPPKDFAALAANRGTAEFQLIDNLV